MTTNTTIAAPSAVAEIGPAPGGRSYQYKHGDRPLDGYTIQRGAGRGGFGEVYYALSDSGREVALKLILTYEQIELRGISQCMNLKSPHLVTIFDVKYGQDGRPWVIMEYVAGPSLRQLLDAAPSGLGAQKAAFFLREIGKGLTYLHDCGIVHRDLKPGNIFYENGYVKIGDYGLSKIISASQHSGQTITVGTVHYMAPEIGVGNYDRGIDIYAMGALLFEMVIGQVPFFGSSTAEVLMKHLSSEVDLSAIEEPFKSVIRKAMAKNPAERCQSVQEMVEAVFGSEHVRNSVSHFSPDSLTIVAGYAAQKIPPSGGSFTPSDVPGAAPALPCDRWGRLAASMDRMGEKFSRKQARWAQRLARKQARWGGQGWARTPQPIPPESFASGQGDPLKLWHRIVLGLIVSGLVAVAAGVFGAAVLDHPEVGMLAFFITVATTAGAVAAWRLVGPALRHESGLLVRLGIGGAAALVSSPFLLAMAFADPFARHHRSMGGTVLAIFVTLLLLDWPHRLSATRAERVALGNLIRAALLGLILSSMFDGLQPLAILILVGISLASEVVAGFGGRGAFAPTFGTPPARPQSPIPGPAPTQPAPPVLFPPAPPPPASAFARPVPRGARAIWLTFFVGFATLGLCLLLAMGTVHSDRSDRAAMFGFGAGAILFAIFCLRRSRRTAFIGYWEYLFRPVFQLLCLYSILLAVSSLTIGGLHGDDAMPAIFFIVFPSLVLFALTFLTRRGVPMAHTPVAQIPIAPSTVRLPPSSEMISFSGIVFGFSRFVLNVVGSLVLVFSLLVALAVVTDLPGLFESGVLDPRMPHDLTQAFGTSDWPHLMRQAGAVMSFITALVATGVLMLPRRRFGPGYMLRGVLGIGVLFLAVAALGRALPDWRDVSGGENFGSALSMYLQSVHGPRVVWAAVLLVAGQFLLLWPARRSRERDLPAYPLPPGPQGELHPENHAG